MRHFIGFLCAFSLLFCQGCDASNMRFNVYYSARDVLHYCDSIRFSSAVPFFYQKKYETLIGMPAPQSCRDTLRYVEKILTEQLNNHSLVGKGKKTAMRESLAIQLVRTYMMLNEEEKASEVLNGMFLSSRAYLYMCELNMVHGYGLLALENFMYVKKNELHADDAFVFSQMEALMYYVRGDYAMAADALFALSKGKNNEIISVYGLFSAANMYIEAGEKRKAYALYSYIERKHKKYAQYAQVQLYRCFEPLDDNPEILVQKIQRAENSDVKAHAYYAQGCVWVAALEYEKADSVFAVAEKADSSLFPLYAKEVVTMLWNTKKYSKVGQICAKVMEKTYCDGGNADFFVKKYIDASLKDGTKSVSLREEQEYKKAYSLFLNSQYDSAQIFIERFLAENKGVFIEHKFRLLSAVCRGREYGKGAMVRSMRGVEMLFPRSTSGVLASRIVKMYGNEGK
ncbi:MAG: hypothetical protein PHD21_04320 [Flavobacteriales bacterium]|nr:hypothetical protein [Flavobacteriales bacterium]